MEKKKNGIFEFFDPTLPLKYAFFLGFNELEILYRRIVEVTNYESERNIQKFIMATKEDVRRNKHADKMNMQRVGVKIWNHEM